MNIENFIQYLVNEQGKSAETAKAYACDLRLFEKFLADRGIQLNNATIREISDYIAHLKRQHNRRFNKQGLSRASIGRRIAGIRKYFDFFRTHYDAEAKNPTAGIRVGNPQNDDCKAVEDRDIDTLLNGITSLRDRALFTLFLSSGLRVAELHQLNRSTIEIDQGNSDTEEMRTLGTGEVVGKRRKRRRFYFDADALELLMQYLGTRNDSNPALFVSHRTERLSIRAMQQILSNWCRRLGLQQIHVHQLRHTYATRLVNANIDSMVLKTLMGHEDLRTTHRYSKLEDRTLARQYFAAMEFRRQ